MTHLLKQFKPLLSAILINVLVVIALLQFFVYERSSLFLLLLMTLIYVPLMLSNYIFGFVRSSLSLSLILIAIALKIDIEFSLGIISMFTIPLIITYFSFNPSQNVLLQKKNFSHNLAYVIIYFVILMVAMLCYISFYLNGNLFNTLNDFLLFLYMGLDPATLSFIKANSFDIYLVFEIITFILPTLVGIFILCWFMINLQIYYLILNKFILTSPNKLALFGGINLPKIYTIVTILMLIGAILSHKLLANYTNLHYIIYNGFLLLLFGYGISGLSFLYHRIKKYKNFLLWIFIIFAFAFLLIEVLLFCVVIGFLKEINKFFGFLSL